MAGRTGAIRWERGGRGMYRQERQGDAGNPAIIGTHGEDGNPDIIGRRSPACLWETKKTDGS